MSDANTLLVQVSGKDQPGIVADVIRLLSGNCSEIQDIEQIVIRGNISLGIVATVPAGHSLEEKLQRFGSDNQLRVDVRVVEDAPTVRQAGWIVTVIGRQLAAEHLHAVTAAIAETGSNIDRIVRLSRYPVWSYELLVSGADNTRLKPALLACAAASPNFDIAVQREGLGRRSQRLVVLDVDSTLIQDEVIDLLADIAGCGAQVAAITESAMRGELDFAESLQARVALLAGQPAKIIDQAFARLRMTPGARTFVRTLKRLGYRVAIVSGGFTDFTDRLAQELDLDYAYANTLEIQDGKLTGKTTGALVDRAGKAKLVRKMAEREGIQLSQVVAIGDGANDLDMLATAGLGIAFNAKPLVARAADTALSVPYLDAVLSVLGVRREEVVSAGLSTDK